MSEILRDSIFWVEVDRIKPNPYQPRRDFDQAKLQELADSIRMYGLLQPLTVTRTEYPQEDGGLRVEYELIAGERRLRASKLAGIAQVPVIIRTGEEDNLLKLELAIIENLQREDLNPIDRARAFERLVKEFGFKQVDVGKKMGRSREYVTNSIRLLAMPTYIQEYLSEGRITEGHTRPILMLNDRPEEQEVLVKEILIKKLTVREAEAVARRVAQDKVSQKYKMDPELLALERELTERLGTRVQIEPREVGGRVVISYFSANELVGLLESMKSEAEALRGQSNNAPVTLTPEQVASSESPTGMESMEPVGDTQPSTASFVTELNDSSEERITPTVTPDTNETVVGVVPDMTRPMPEPVSVDELLETSGEEGLHLSEASALLDDRSKDERTDEDDLYSIRNFSI